MGTFDYGNPLKCPPPTNSKKKDNDRFLVLIPISGNGTPPTLPWSISTYYSPHDTIPASIEGLSAQFDGSRGGEYGDHDIPCDPCGGG